MKNNAEQKIYLSDIVKYLRTKLKNILIGALIIMVIVAAVMTVTGMKKSSKAAEETAESTEESIAAESTEESIAADSTEQESAEELANYQRIGISPAEVRKIELAVSVKNAERAYYKEITSLRENSNTYVIQYALKANGSAENLNGTGETVRYAIQEYIENGGLTLAVSESGFKSMDQTEISSNVVFSYTDMNTASGQTGDEQTVSGSSLYPFVITCTGSSAEEAKSLSQQVNTEIKEFIEKYSSSYSVELVECDEYTGLVDENSRTERIDEINAKMINEENQYNTLYNKFTTSQKVVVNAMVSNFVQYVNELDEETVVTIIDKINALPVEETVETTDTEDAEEVKSVTVEKFNLTKTLVMAIPLGFVIGFVIMIILYIIKYAFSKTIRTAKEASNVFGLFCFGDWKNIDKDKSLTKKKALTVANIKAACSRDGLKNVALVTVDPDDRKIRSEAEFIAAELSTADISFEFAGNIIDNVAAFERTLQKDAVILWIKTLKTKSESIEKIAELSVEHKINIIGAICE